MDYPWLGNVRELEHVLEHAFVLCHGRVITLEHLPTEISNYEKSEKITIPKTNAKEPKQAQEILDALNKTDWNKAKAARMLGIGRRTIYRKINLFQFPNEK
jgi:transcriptional regulator of acetoin/glycerol metabolism